MRCSLLIAAILLSACATLETEAPDTETATLTTSLPAQVLESGECGLFGYSTDTPPHFIFFASSQGQALYRSKPRETESLQAQEDFPSSDYGSVTLELGFAEALVDGRRYNESRLVETLEDGFERVRPVVVLESCG